jgi:hypothetical protein
VEVGNAQDDGIHVANAGKYGVYVNASGYDAIHIAGTSGDGVDVSADDHGVIVSSAGYDGLHVSSATNEGVDVTGNNMAGYFNGGIQVIGGCIGCTSMTFGVNIGDTPLAPGQVVSLAGLRESGVDSVPVLMEVTTASHGAVVGVVQGWAELIVEQQPRPDEIGLRLASREGAALPGQYVTIAYAGLTKVRALGPIAQGSKLAAGSEDGLVRAPHVVTVEGIELTENVSTVGVALENIDSGEGLIWALINVQ